MATAADPVGNALVVGTCAGDLDFFTQALISTGGNDAFFAKLKP